MTIDRLKHKFQTLISTDRILQKKLVGTFIFRWLPDKMALKLLFHNVFGRKLNLESPITFNEKLQWLKLYNRNPEYTSLVDKIEVKDIVAKLIGPEYVIPTIGVFDNFNEIDFSVLPNKFVIKTNHGGGNTGVVICRDKNNFDISAARYRIENSLATDTYMIGREWPYKNVKRRILIEALLETPYEGDLIDYKFFCFDGEPKFCQVIKNRTSGETIEFFDMNWERQEFVGLTPGIKKPESSASKPIEFEQMKDIASKLSQGKQFVRVDLYNLNGVIYFGELTFFPASGFGCFSPEHYDRIIGDMIDLKKDKLLPYNN